MVLGNVFFYSNSNLKSVEQFIFLLEKDLGFGECFFLFKFQLKIMILNVFGPVVDCLPPNVAVLFKSLS